MFSWWHKSVSLEELFGNSVLTKVLDFFLENFFLENRSAVEIMVYDWNFLNINGIKPSHEQIRPSEDLFKNGNCLWGGTIKPYTNKQYKIEIEPNNMDEFLKNNKHLIIELEGNFGKERIKIEIDKSKR